MGGLPRPQAGADRDVEHRVTRRLTKRDVERLLAGYDADPVGALTDALRVVTGAGDAEWDELVELATDDARRRAALAARDVAALDSLAAELNELRALERPGDPPGATRSRARGRATP